MLLQLDAIPVGLAAEISRTVSEISNPFGSVWASLMDELLEWLDSMYIDAATAPRRPLIEHDPTTKPSEGLQQLTSARSLAKIAPADYAN